MYAIAAILVVAFLVVRFILYPAFFSPLASIPAAHPTAAFSDAWILWHRYREDEGTTIREAHRIHGPLVRLGPNEVSVNTPADVNAIYTTFEKWPWYGFFANYRVNNMFSMYTKDPHTVRKKLVNKVYTKTFIQKSSDLTALSDALLRGRLLPRLAAVADAATPQVDVLQLNFDFAMDMIVGYLWGSSAASHQTDAPHPSQFPFRPYNDAKPALFWFAEIPGVTNLLHRMGLDPVPVERVSYGKVEAWGLERGQATDQVMAEGATTTSEKSPLPPTSPIVYQHVKEGLQSTAATLASKAATPEPPLAMDVASELLDHTLAGYETIGSNLSFLMWEMSSRPALQARLRAELLTTGTGLLQHSTEPLPLRALDQLPLLDAIITESLRRWTPVPTSLPRITPVGGCVLGGKTIPAGTRVSATALPLHHHEAVFPQPNEWRPERWLVDAEERREMDRWFWPFASGNRMCIGKWFALQEMKMVVGAVYANFETSRTSAEDVQQSQAFPGIPTKGRLDLTFKRVAP